ncbi:MULTISPECIES: hypothetical protein [Gordonia]|uniref:Uncharacterized protein n=1 Tax=Gordonia sihwensis NBRC 108236 TaxID=1223544 RepID=L7LHD9_9ACTN|nr:MULTISPECIES: hypothetical protein [Gordonia]AUH69790.1 hypothetical protein CXX93_17645 [Gordonia sp. YC-JH1]GAC59497.1 hypothetical protein GSI01S_02_01400 [Gordonia sihwensis NBRC 108236]
MIDHDDDLIRLSPIGHLKLTVFDANTSIGPVECPVLSFTDQRLGDFALLLDPVIEQAQHLHAVLGDYLQGHLHRQEEG